jgi:hypothetical protein
MLKGKLPKEIAESEKVKLELQKIRKSIQE